MEEYKPTNNISIDLLQYDMRPKNFVLSCTDILQANRHALKPALRSEIQNKEEFYLESYCKSQNACNNTKVVLDWYYIYIYIYIYI